MDWSLFHENTSLVPFFLVLASMRVYLEIVGFDFLKLPLSNTISHRIGESRMLNIHQMGLICSVGYILLFAPSYLLS